MRISNTKLGKIWKTIIPKEATWYPKFTDLAWCIVLNKVHTGERWMTRYNCPECLVPQVTQHLFWECPLAQAVWNRASLVWQRITDDPFPLPKHWGEVVLATISKKPKGTTRRRWLVFYSEVLWTLWAHRCAWSFDEIHDFERVGLLGRFDNRISLRLLIDR